MELLWILLIFAVAALGLVIVISILLRKYRFHTKTSPRKASKSTNSPRDKDCIHVSSIDSYKNKSQVKMAEKDIQPEKCLKKGVRFGKNEEIPYEPTFEGGYAYTAVKATKLNENKNRRRTLELILKPDKFSVTFIPENPAGVSSSLYTNDINMDNDLKNRLS